ncbi:MAG TPA: SET domain-containing protein [Streptosporangiaceae bacterium]
MSYTNCDLVEEYVLANGQKGIRARADIPAGTIIGIFDGEIRQFKLDEGRLADADAHKEIAQVAVVDDVLLGLVTPPDAPFYGIDYMNHSCDPNVVVRDTIVVATTRAVAAGEVLTTDYRLWDLIPEGIPCWCSPSRCSI